MFGKFSIIRDEEGPEVAIISPSPIVLFESIQALQEWVNELQDLIAGMGDADLKKSSIPLTNTYASQVIKEWQTLLQKSQGSSGTET
jgi:hypothetical protein